MSSRVEGALSYGIKYFYDACRCMCTCFCDGITLQKSTETS